MVISPNFVRGCLRLSGICRNTVIGGLQSYSYRANYCKVYPSFQTFSTSSHKMTKSALILLACGAEELETVAVIDILARAKVKVVVAGVGGSSVATGRSGIKIQPDVALSDVMGTAYDLVYLPGGLDGMKALSKSAEVGKVLKAQYENKRLIAAICAAPCALKAHGIGKGSKVTSYPSMKVDLEDYYDYHDETIVEDGPLITSRGPGTATALGLRLAEILTDHETAKSVASGMLLPF